MAKKKYYASPESRSFLNEDKSAPSNCPREVKMMEYPKNIYIETNVSDDFQAMDRQVHDAIKVAKAHLARKKY